MSLRKFVINTLSKSDLVVTVDIENASYYPGDMVKAKVKFR